MEGKANSQLVQSRGQTKAGRSCGYTATEWGKGPGKGF